MRREPAAGNGQPATGALPVVGQPSNGVATPAAAPPAPTGNGHDEVFARAVGLAEAPAKAKRGRRRKTNTSRPVVTAEDAARLAQQTQSIPTQVQRVANAPGDPATQTSVDRENWLQRRRSRVRRTRRTIRHIDPWSVFKVSLLLYICLYIAAMIAGMLLWSAAINSGVIDNIESFVEEVGSYAVWQLDGEEIFRRTSVIGIVLMVAGVAFNVLMAIVFNLISDLVGGVRVTILEEDTVVQPTV